MLRTKDQPAKKPGRTVAHQLLAPVAAGDVAESTETVPRATQQPKTSETDSVRAPTADNGPTSAVLPVLEDSDESLVLLPKAIEFALDRLAKDFNNVSSTERDAIYRLFTAILDNIPWMLTTDSNKLDKALMFAVRSDSRVNRIHAGAFVVLRRH